MRTWFQIQQGGQGNYLGNLTFKKIIKFYRAELSPARRTAQLTLTRPPLCRLGILLYTAAAAQHFTLHIHSICLRSRWAIASTRALHAYRRYRYQHFATTSWRFIYWLSMTIEDFGKVAIMTQPFDHFQWRIDRAKLSQWLIETGWRRAEQSNVIESMDSMVIDSIGCEGWSTRDHGWLRLVNFSVRDDFDSLFWALGLSLSLSFLA